MFTPGTPMPIARTLRRWGFRAAFVLFLGVPASQALAQDISAQNVHVDPAGQNTGTLTDGLVFGGSIVYLLPGPIRGGVPVKETSPAATGIASSGSLPNKNGLDFYTPSFLVGKPTVRMSLTAGGRLGIGTTTPSRALEIDAPGSVELGLKSNDPNGTLWTLQSTGTAEGGDASLNSTFQIIDRSLGVKRLEIDKSGVVSVNVMKINGGSDIAEPFDVDGEFAPGSVVVIDERAPGRLRLSYRPYDRKVAGVVSGAGGVKTGLTLVQLAGPGPQSAVALSGRVFALADASRGPIAPGDLLTTSRVPGHAMKALNLDRARGATLGKAMSSLSSGSGLVLVLVGLQ